MSLLREQVTEAAAWLEREARRVAFGELQITLVLHAGRVVRVEHGVIERMQPGSGAEGGGGGS